MTRWLLSRGADPNGKTARGPSVIHHAVSGAPLDSLKVLVEYGASLTRHVDLVAYATREATRRTTRRTNRRDQQKEVIKYLLDNEAYVDGYFNEKNHDQNADSVMMVIGKQNALHFAVAAGDMELVQLLVYAGANTFLPTCSMENSKDKNLSPVELARMHGQEGIAKFLERMGG